MSNILPAKIYPLSVPANGSFPLLVYGDYFKIMSASGTVEVTGDSFGTLGELRPGQGLEDTAFRRLTFRDTSGAVNNIKVLIAGDKFVDDTTFGEVAVIDAAYARVLSQQAFMSAASVTTTGVNKGNLQLFNQSTTKNLVVEQLSFTTSAAMGVDLYMSAAGATLATLVKAATSKLASGAASAAAQLRSAEAAVAGTQVGSFGIDVAAKTYVYLPKTPLVIPPNYGLNLTTTTTAAHVLTGVIEHVETLIV